VSSTASIAATGVSVRTLWYSLSTEQNSIGVTSLSDRFLPCKAIGTLKSIETTRAANMASKSRISLPRLSSPR
jgi:hypothetical protein